MWDRCSCIEYVGLWVRDDDTGVYRFIWTVNYSDSDQTLLTSNRILFCFRWSTVQRGIQQNVNAYAETWDQCNS